MNMHASPTILPELDDFLSTFNLKLRRSGGEAALERYLTVCSLNCPINTVTPWPLPS
jgi:hypothetical protein